LSLSFDGNLSGEDIGFSFAPDDHTGDFLLAQKIEAAGDNMGNLAVCEDRTVRTHAP
jgi:hypothetical protein